MRKLLPLWLVLSACTKVDETDTDGVETETDDSDVDTDTNIETDTDTDTETEELPACTSVNQSMSFTRDEGATWTPGFVPAVNSPGNGLAVVQDNPDELWAQVDSAFWHSTDGGCTWVDAGVDVFDDFFKLVPAPDGVIYGYNDNRSQFVRIADGDVEITEANSIATIADVAMVGFGVDPHDSDHVFLASSDVRVFESKDAGATWTLFDHVTMNGANGVYRVVWDPTDSSHVIAGTVSGGAYVSEDSGATWARASGISLGNANIFSVAISPVDGDVVWVEGIDIAEMDGGANTEGRHIWQSTDGGTTYTPVVDKSAEVTLYNGNLMVPHPTDANVVYFVFGTYFAGYGTDVFRYDATTDALTVEHSNDFHDLGALAFRPGDASVMYGVVLREQVD